MFPVYNLRDIICGNKNFEKSIKLSERKTPNSKVYLLSPSVRVQVKYNPKDKKTVTFDDDPHAIQARNPQLKPSEWQDWLNELLKREMQR